MSGPWSSPPPQDHPPVSKAANLYRLFPMQMAMFTGIFGLVNGMVITAFGAPVAAGLCMILASTAYYAGRAFRVTAPYQDNPQASRRTGLALYAGALAMIPMTAVIIAETPPAATTPPPDRLDRYAGRLKTVADAAFGCNSEMTVERAPDQTPVAVTFRCPAPPAA